MRFLVQRWPNAIEVEFFEGLMRKEGGPARGKRVKEKRTLVLASLGGVLLALLSIERGEGEIVLGCRGEGGGVAENAMSTRQTRAFGGLFRGCSTRCFKKKGSAHGGAEGS